MFITFFVQQPHDIDHVIPKKIKKEQQQLQPKKDKASDIPHIPLLPLPLHRQVPRKPLSIKEKMASLESCLKKIKTKDAKKMKESNENTKPNHETIDSSTKPPKEGSQVPVEKLKEKRKPGRPGKKKISA